MCFVSILNCVFNHFLLGHYTGKQLAAQLTLSSLHLLLWDRASKNFEVLHQFYVFNKYFKTIFRNAINTLDWIIIQLQIRVLLPHWKHFIISYLKSFGSARHFLYVFERSVLFSPRLHLKIWLKQWYCKISNYSLKQLYFNILYSIPQSHDPSYIILICWFASQKTCLYYNQR